MVCDEIIDVDTYVPRCNWRCPFCRAFSAGLEAALDHRSQCLARILAVVMQLEQFRQQILQKEQ